MFANTTRITNTINKYNIGRPRVVPRPTGIIPSLFSYSTTPGRGIGHIEAASSPSPPSPSLSEPPLRLGPNLSKYGVNLNKQVMEGKIDPVIGRKKEIERTIQILSRRTKNNPCLIGEPGVGTSPYLLGSLLQKGDVPLPAGIVFKNNNLTQFYDLDFRSLFDRIFDIHIHGYPDNFLH